MDDKSMDKRIAGGIVAILLVGSCMSPTMHDYPTVGPLPADWDKEIRSQFAEAQDMLVCLGYSRAKEVRPEHFTWLPESRQVRCGGSGYHSGCFGTSGAGVIQFYTGHAFVIRHESGHAILWKMNARPLWKCFEHPEKSWCPKKLREIDWEENCADKN